MKTKLLCLIWLLAVSTCLVALVPPEMGSGQFDAELGICSHNGVTYLVYNTNNSADQSGDIVLKYRQSGADYWISKTVASGIAGLTKPTVAASDAKIIVSYTDGWESNMATSSDQGETWQLSSMGRSFESSPYVEEVGGEYSRYSLILPYPQHDQDKYLVRENSNELVAYHRSVVSGLNQDGNLIVFKATEVIEGNYRTDADIWIQASGNNWPVFNGLVITSGQVRVYPEGGSDFPMETVFPGGLIEHAPFIPYDNQYQMYGRLVGPGAHDERYIVLVVGNGTTTNVYLGIKSTLGQAQLGVHPVYPAENLGDPLYFNTIAQIDTVWNAMSSGDGNMFHSHNELWIKGTFSGHQAWSSSSDIKIIGDILLAGTPAGEDPRNNTNDSVKLVSNKNIEIKYGYCDPLDSLRYHVCRPDSEPIQIYASLTARGISPTGSNGCLTFEYQHPHPSVPDVNMYGSYWDNIDLHRYQYPPDADNPWPATIDYPYYNPLWPEANPYLERGTVQIWGYLHEGRKGYLHREYVNPDNPIWDIENNLYGSSSAPSVTAHIDPVLGMQLGTVNYPGASGNGIGYKKEHTGDARASFSTSLTLGYAYPLEAHEIPDPDDPSNNLFIYTMLTPDAVRSKLIARNGSAALFAVNDKLLFDDGADKRWKMPFDIEDNAIIEQMEWVDDQRVMILRYNASNPEPYSLHIYDPNLLYTEHVVDVPAGIFGDQQDQARAVFCDILPAVDGNGRFAVYSVNPNAAVQGTLEIFNIDIQSGEFTPHRWGELPWDNSWDRELQHQLSLKNVTDDQCDVILNIQHDGAPPYSSIRYATIGLSEHSSADHPTVPAAKPSVAVYPNPSRTDFSITLKDVAPSEVKAEFYNIRGQKVAEIKDVGPSSATGLNIRWQALDEKQQRLAAGVYLMRIKQSGKVIASKRITVF